MEIESHAPLNIRLDDADKEYVKITLSIRMMYLVIGSV